MTADWSLAIWFHSRIAAKPPQPRAQARGWEFQRLPSAECQSKTTGSRPWLELFRRYAADIRFHSKLVTYPQLDASGSPVSSERRVISFSVARATHSSHGKANWLFRNRHLNGTPRARRSAVVRRI